MRGEEGWRSMPAEYQSGYVAGVQAERERDLAMFLMDRIPISQPVAEELAIEWATGKEGASDE